MTFVADDAALQWGTAAFGDVIGFVRLLGKPRAESMCEYRHLA